MRPAPIRFRGFDGLRVPELVLGALVTFGLGIVTASMMVFPATRLVELSEHGVERIEQLSPVVRVLGDKQSRQERRRANLPIFPPSFRTLVKLSRISPADIHPPAGHRLPNGLLAPLTC